jgi:hypothetical protein
MASTDGTGQMWSAHRRDVHHSAPEVVPDQHGPLDPNVREPGEEAVGLGAHGDLAVTPVGDAVAVPHHLEREHARAGQARQDAPPQRG